MKKDRSLKKLAKSKKGDLGVLTIVIIPTIVMIVFGILSYDARNSDIKRSIQGALDSSLFFVSQTGLNGKLENGDKEPIYVCTFPDKEKLKEKFEGIAIQTFFVDGVDCYNPTWKFDYSVVKKENSYVDTFNVKLTAYVPIGTINDWNSYYNKMTSWSTGDINNVEKNTYNTFYFEASTQCRGNK